MNEELKPCPFCGINDWRCHAYFSGTKIRQCGECGTIVDESTINTRPIEDALTARIAELEAEIDQLTAHDAIERQGDKSPNDTQTQTIVYGKWIPVSERLPDRGHREFYEVACIYQDFGELALFSKGRWVIYEGENVYDVTKQVKFWRKRQYLPDEVIAVLSKGETNPEVQE